MNRLTNKAILEKMNNFPKDYIFSTEELIYMKLGQIEDTEEKLGIDFITLYKAFENDIRVFDDGKPYTAWVDLIYSKGIPYGFKCKVSDHCVYFKDFGKTWTLATKEELE